jgi:uncharacterized protein (DUF169 family)
MRLSPIQLESLASLGLDSPPVAIAFLSSPPEGLPRVSRPDSAGCAYWNRAAEGQAFYTTAEDHANCAIGAYTHGVTSTPALETELQRLVNTMVELKYITSDEVPSIPKRLSPFEVAAYAPLERATFAPDLVVFRGKARQIMLLSEAARAAGVFGAGSVMGRPACAMLPQSLATHDGVASVGCVGNRVYTGLRDDELYITVPGDRVGAVLDKLAPTLVANQTLERFHRDRAAALSN